ncbi:MAG TPA: phosphatidate cytidylyltransferase [Rhizomicrobium sp.]|nr:phosphatidate cytidylyltransferase [Rhizomicrobium sp.]
MNRSSPVSGSPDHAPGYKGIRFNLDWITRPLFGGALAALAVAAVFGGAPFVAVLAVVVAVAGAREWHRLVGERVFGSAFFVTAATVAVALAADVAWPHGWYGAAIIGVGAIAAAVVAATRRELPLWHGFGPLYLGIAAISILALRDAPHGAWVIVGLFLAVWASDTGALFTGNLVGGPRLWPALSPNKTWSGTIGGVATAAVVEAIFVAILGGTPWQAGLYGAAVAIVAVLGDLFESWVKRVFQRKDSGHLIPGHGGVLDRIDSTLFAAPAVALAVIGLGLNTLFGAHP